jgi:hypothetical protein
VGVGEGVVDCCTADGVTVFGGDTIDADGAGVEGMLGIVGDSVIGAASGLTQLVVNNVNKSRSISARSFVLNIPSTSYQRVMVFHLHYGANS